MSKSNSTYVIAKHSNDWLFAEREYLILDVNTKNYLIEDDNGEVDWVGSSHFTGEIVVKGDDEAATTPNILPTDSAERKTYPVYSGFLKYFPDAMAMVSNHSYKGNQQHNPDSELHWDRSKSGDDGDAMLRHTLDFLAAELSNDIEEMRLAAGAIAWRACAVAGKILDKCDGVK